MRARGTDTLPVEASWWWDGLPPHPPNVEPMTPLATLARIWVNPEARLAARPSAGVQGFQGIIHQLREQSQQQGMNIQRLDMENQQLTGTNQQLTSDNIQLTRDNNNLREAIDRLHQDIARLIDGIQTERNARNQQEQYTNYYRAQHDRVQNQFDTLFAEKEMADRHAQRARHPRGEDHRDSGNGTRERERLHHRDPTPRDHPPRSSQPRTSVRSHTRPPMAYETQGRSRRRSSSSSRRSDRSSDRWSGTSTAVNSPYNRSYGGESPRGPPPVPTHTRPFRT